LIAALRAAETERSGGQKGKGGLGKMNFRPAFVSDSDFSAAAKFSASETGASPILISQSLFLFPQLLRDYGLSYFYLRLLK